MLDLTFATVTNASTLQPPSLDAPVPTATAADPYGVGCRRGEGGSERRWAQDRRWGWRRDRRRPRRRRGRDGSHRRRPAKLYGVVLTLRATMSPRSRTATRNAAADLLPFLADLLRLSHAVSDQAPIRSGLAAPHPGEPRQSPDVPRGHRFLCRRPMATRRGSQRIVDGGQLDRREPDLHARGRATEGRHTEHEPSDLVEQGERTPER
jgi:hypothetical protein